MPILFFLGLFLGLSVLDLGPMYATDRRQTKLSLNARGTNVKFHLFPKLKSRRKELIVKIRRDEGRLARKAIDKHIVMPAGMKASFPKVGL